MHRRRDLQREGDELLGEQRPVLAQERRQARPLQVFEDHMWARPFEIGAEAADEHRVVEAVQQLHLRHQPSEGAVVLDQSGANHLDHHQRAQVVIPREVGLVAEAAAEELDRAAAGGDLIALPKPPARLLGISGRCRGLRPVVQFGSSQ
jgi:hypothetical protein